MPAGRNLVKLVAGSALGVAVAAGVSRLVQRQDQPPEERKPLTDEVRSIPIRLQDRWQQAKDSGEAARVAKEDEMKRAFRDKVNDPSALTPPYPPSS